MVDSEQIKLFQRTTETRGPPSVVGILECIPIVLRVAPELTGFAEVVWRHTGDQLWRSIFVQREHVLVAPDIGALVSDEDRHVTAQLNLSFVGVCLQLVPLAIEQELLKARIVDLARHLLASLSQRFGFATTDWIGPLRPIRFFELVQEDFEQGELIEPPIVRVQE